MADERERMSEGILRPSAGQGGGAGRGGAIPGVIGNLKTEVFRALRV